MTFIQDHKSSCQNLGHFLIDQETATRHHVKHVSTVNLMHLDAIQQNLRSQIKFQVKLKPKLVCATVLHALHSHMLVSCLSFSSLWKNAVTLRK